MGDVDLGIGSGVGVVGVNWRVDVTVATSDIHKAFTPAILLQLELTNGEIRTIEVPQAQLHSLRYTLAKMLKDLQYFEKKAPIASLKKKMDQRLVR